MKRLLCLLSAVLLALLLCACGASATPSEEADRSHDLPWRDALINPSLPDGFATPDTVSYLFEEESGLRVENVSFAEIASYLSGRQHLPRTDHFDSFLSDGVRSLLPALDYALCHGCGRLCIPTTAVEGSELFHASRWLDMIYHVKNYGVTGRTVASFQNRAGDTVNYVYISLLGMSDGAFEDRYRAALAEAERIVAAVPEGADEVETARYLYRYLTENVTYDFAYYDDWDMTQSCLLYDALVARSTVCAGYEAALYTLFNLAGIECFPVYGNLYGPSFDRQEAIETGTGHAWSIAKLNGEYYEFDPTWDAGVPPEQYRFFAISTADMQAYYPRVYDAITEEYAPPRVKTLGS